MQSLMRVVPTCLSAGAALAVICLSLAASCSKAPPSLGARGDFGAIDAKMAASRATLAGDAERASVDVRASAPADFDAAMLRARQQAQAELTTIRDRFSSGLEAGDALYVKAPFAAAGGEPNVLWFGVGTWTGDRISGRLASEPADHPGLRPGRSVDILQPDVLDYLLIHADGSCEGNLSGKAIVQMQCDRSTSAAQRSVASP
jgi:hypothetical protein